MKLKFDKVCNSRVLNEELSFINEKFRTMHPEDKTIVEIFDIVKKVITEVDETTEEIISETVEYYKIDYYTVQEEKEDGELVDVKKSNETLIDYQSVVDEIINTIESHDSTVEFETQVEKQEKVIADLTQLLIDKGVIY